MIYLKQKIISNLESSVKLMFMGETEGFLGLGRICPLEGPTKQGMEIIVRKDKES